MQFYIAKLRKENNNVKHFFKYVTLKLFQFTFLGYENFNIFF